MPPTCRLIVLRELHARLISAFNTRLLPQFMTGAITKLISEKLRNLIQSAPMAALKLLA